MARKNLLEVSPKVGMSPERTEQVSDRPLAGFAPPTSRAAPIGGITKSLGNLTDQAARASDIERKLSEGQTVVELDPKLIDASFITDRLEIEAPEVGELAEQIREHGQQVPILVRPHPETRGRYQVAYGHRRLAAVKSLDRNVRAIVRDLTDEQLVISQGQENNARLNLSFIERALFAVGLEDRKFSRDIIMASLGVDKAALSKMISVARQVPREVIAVIGSAPETGRRRWMELANLLDQQKTAEVRGILDTLNLSGQSSDERFQTVYQAMSRRPDKSSSPAPLKTWTPEDKSVSVTLKKSAKTASFVLGSTDAVPFAEWIADNMEDIYKNFRNSKNIK